MTANALAWLGPAVYPSPQATRARTPPPPGSETAFQVNHDPYVFQWHHDV